MLQRVDTTKGSIRKVRENPDRSMKKFPRHNLHKLWHQKAHVVIFEVILICAAIIEGVKFLWFLIRH